LNWQDIYDQITNIIKQYITPVFACYFHLGYCICLFLKSKCIYLILKKISFLNAVDYLWKPKILMPFASQQMEKGLGQWLLKWALQNLQTLHHLDMLTPINPYLTPNPNLMPTCDWTRQVDTFLIYGSKIFRLPKKIIRATQHTQQ